MYLIIGRASLDLEVTPASSDWSGRRSQVGRWVDNRLLAWLRARPLPTVPAPAQGIYDDPADLELGEGTPEHTSTPNSTEEGCQGTFSNYFFSQMISSI